MLKIRGYHRTDTGKSRPHNEDRLCVVPEFDQDSMHGQITIDKGKGILFAIADGMGGTNAGEVAAEIAIDTVRNSAEKIEAILLRPAEIGKGLESIIYKAHVNIKGALNDENAGMGTTLILLLITGNALHVAWCGDSRAYKYSPTIMERKNKYDLPHLKILTHDHSVVWDMVRKGKLDPNAAREHELSNIITQSLGDPSNEPSRNLQYIPLLPGIRYWYVRMG
jgi:serine/threonine protein phosphatase PrpC